MPFENFHLIHPIDDAAEAEYTKKFLRWMGCPVYRKPVETRDPLGWGLKLPTTNEEGGVDIVMNYYGTDPYAPLCKANGVRRVYFYFDLETGFVAACAEPLMEKGELKKTDHYARDQALPALITFLWGGQPDVLDSIQQIYHYYAEQDLFYLMQAKRCLRVLKMGEVVQYPEMVIQYVPLEPYIQTMLRSLSTFYDKLDGNETIYGRYARVNAAITMWSVENKLSTFDKSRLKTLTPPIQTINPQEVYDILHRLLAPNHTGISADLLCARYCKENAGYRNTEETIYHEIQANIPPDRPEYAFVWYRIGRYCEKVTHDVEAALLYYKKAVQTDPNCYQALFKLGFFAAVDGRYQEAEGILNDVVQVVFQGRNSGPEPNGTYPNWFNLSLKDCQYVYKASIWLAKIAINCNRDPAAKAYIGTACMAATRFEDASLEQRLLNMFEKDSINYTIFFDYHDRSVAVRAMWRALEPWTEHIILDPYLRDIVRRRLYRWS